MGVDRARRRVAAIRSMLRTKQNPEESWKVPMAKGQKKSNREIRKPKADKPKVAPAGPSAFLTPPSKKK